MGVTSEPETNENWCGSVRFYKDTHKYYSLKVFLIIIIEQCSPRLLLVKSNKSFLNVSESHFMLTSTWNNNLLPAHLFRAQTWENIIFALFGIKMQIHSLPLGATFGAVKLAVSPVTLHTMHHCAHKPDYQALLQGCHNSVPGGPVSFRI